jgi:uncharacterized protein
MDTAVAKEIQRHRALVATLCRRHRARWLDLFGSATRDDFDVQHSDLDFLVEFEELEPSQYAQAYFELKEGLERIFERPVDLVTANNLGNPYFGQRVQRERLNLYARGRCQADLGRTTGLAADRTICPASLRSETY